MILLSILFARGRANVAPPRHISKPCLRLHEFTPRCPSACGEGGSKQLDRPPCGSVMVLEKARLAVGAMCCLAEGSKEVRQPVQVMRRCTTELWPICRLVLYFRCSPSLEALQTVQSHANDAIFLSAQVRMLVLLSCLGRCTVAFRRLGSSCSSVASLKPRASPSLEDQRSPASATTARAQPATIASVLSLQADFGQR